MGRKTSGIMHRERYVIDGKIVTYCGKRGFPSSEVRGAIVTGWHGSSLTLTTCDPRVVITCTLCNRSLEAQRVGNKKIPKRRIAFEG